MISFFRVFAAVLAALIIVSMPAAARNVPGSSAEVQDKVDLEVGSEITDLSVESASSGALYYFCDNGVRRNTEVTEKDLRNENCNWGLNFRGELIHLAGNTSGYDYDSTVGIASALVSYQMTDQTKLVMGLIFEKGTTDTHYNAGDVDFIGYGGTLGIVHDINDAFRLSLLGGAEWLNYDFSRSNGLYSGEYDALRLTFDAAVSGTLGDNDLWVAYRAGLRYIHQHNENYTEYFGSAPFAIVGGSDIESLLLVSNFRIGRTIENVMPFVEASSNFAIADTSSSVIDETNWHGRVGVGLAAEMASGILEMKSGVRLTEDGYAGYDLQIGYSLPF
jgi:Autotransporter beta-domain